MVQFPILSVLVIAISLMAVGAAGAEDRVGRDVAREYFGGQNGVASSQPSSLRLMWIHFGLYTEDESFDWAGDGRTDDTGRGTAGVTYRVGEWTNSMDLHMRIDFNWYSLEGEKPLKMTLMPLITFPDAASGFPLYFGAGAGAGIFFRQLEGESNLSLDYQVLAGLRFFNVFPETGFFLEAGMKNHLHLLSTGQFNGVFVASGAVFTF